MQVTKEYARSVYDALMLYYEMWDELAGMESAKRGEGSHYDKEKTSAFKRTGIYCSACKHISLYRFDGDCNKGCIMP